MARVFFKRPEAESNLKIDLKLFSHWASQQSHKFAAGCAHACEDVRRYPVPMHGFGVRTTAITYFSWPRCEGFCQVGLCRAFVSHTLPVGWGATLKQTYYPDAFQARD